MKKASFFKVTLVTLLLFSLFACGSRSDKSKKELSVSILPLKYLIDQIACDDFEVTVIVPPGSNPETYEPTASQMKALASSAAYFQIGLIDFETNLTGGIATNAPSLPVLNLSQKMELLGGSCDHTPEASGVYHHHGTDPHIWFSPERIKIMARSIAEQLMEIAPDSAKKYQKNLGSILSSIDSLDIYIRHRTSELDEKSILIYHPFLTYYCADYGLSQVAVEQDGKEPSVRHMKHLVTEIKNKNLTTLFYQEQLHRHTVDALIKEAGIRAVPVDPVSYDLLDNIKTITDYITNP